MRLPRRGPGFIACLAVLGAFVVENHCSIPVFESRRFDHLQLAQHHLRSGFPDRALTEAARAARENGDDVAPLVVMARAYHQQEETEKAVEALVQAIRIDPDDGGLYTLLRRMCNDAGRADLAVESFERLFAESPENWYARTALGWAYVSTDSMAATRGLDLLESAVADSAEVSDESLVFACNQLASAYLRRHRIEAAVGILERGLELDPDDRLALLMLGECRIEQGRADDAEQLFDRLLDLVDDLPVAASRIAGLWYDAGQRRPAIRYYEQALAAAPPSASLLNNLAWTYAEEGISLDRAHDLSLRAVKADADNVVFLDTYAEVLHRQGRHRQAAALMRRAVELEPSHGEHYDYLNGQLHKFVAAAGAAVGSDSRDQ